MTKTKLTKNQKQEIKNQVDKQLTKEKLSKTAYLRSQFKQHISTAIIAAFSFLIALAWRDLISNLINSQIHLLGVEGNGNTSLLIIALIITFFSVIGIITISNWAKKQ